MFALLSSLLPLVLFSSATAYPRVPWHWCALAANPPICRRAALDLNEALLSAVENVRRSANQGPVSNALFNAIRMVESGGHCLNKDPCRVTGDGGRALGPYQIHHVYYQDAVQYRPTLGKRPYGDVIYDDFARQIIQAYMSRYATCSRLGHSPTDEDIARIHNGGPNGYRLKATDSYWQKVRAQLNG